MKVLVKDGPKTWLLQWSLDGRRYYLINKRNVVPVGNLDRYRQQINRLYSGQVDAVVFDGCYCRETKTLALSA